ncbi:MAG TPA: VWA domain-containing protein [Leptospiraceae bacterium]|nr:VWA domain-containing protein [Leptospiraceae bacterium]HMX34164.1 VWA domain-containing protein [Leptospiraceae bacterium]HMY30251.1 VWA domain-containing protein [Leptospiraceae bacterium]HMZ66144.1 VWA domain-containing protein [Leptospiraceae bacterium]HNA07170.1 VWA domain-containing protein [Leptospiraceae bacterium]
MKLQKNFLQKIFSTIKRPFFLLVLFIIFILSFQCSSSEKKTFPEKAYDEEKGSSSPMSPSDSDRKKSKELDKKNPKEEKTVDAKPTSVSEKSESGLKAGYADDNKQFNLFLNFLDKFKSSAAHIDLDVKERIIFFVKDKNSRSIPNASIQILANNKELTTGTTYSDGSFLFFPSLYNDVYKFKARITKDNSKTEIEFDRQGARTKEVILDYPQAKENEVPVDIVFVMDTTGSMGEEIQRLKSTIEIINLNLTGNSKNEIRFGMVLYRDKKEEYVTKVIPLTNDLENFKKELNKVSAGGGGDYPEDLQSALKDTIKEIDWRKNAVKLTFIITDAPPHLDYKQEYTYISAMKEASERGIKLYSIGTGGLDINGEYVLRQISQFTNSKYIFLTYGEKGESEGGASGSVSHHTGANFPTDKLETIVIRFAKEEIQAAMGKPLANGEDYFTANKIDSEKKEETLNKLFDQAITQLVDYSTFSIKTGTTVGILPFAVENSSLNKNGEYFSEQMVLGFSRNKTFKIVERKDLQKVLAEWKLNLQAVDESNAIKVGKLLGANLLVNSKIFKKGSSYEIYVKMINSETGEIQSATKLIVDTKLGL